MELRDIIICVVVVWVFLYAEMYKKKYKELQKAFNFLAKRLYPSLTAELIAGKIIGDMLKGKNGKS